MKVLLYIPVFYFLLSSAFIASYGLQENGCIADTAVVLGSKVETSGVPSNRLKARLDRSIQLYWQGCYSKIIVSGGLGKEGFDEAEIMKKYLISKGISESSVIEDSEGNTTEKTAENIEKVFGRIPDTCIIITQYWHIFRTSRIFEKRNSCRSVLYSYARYSELRDIYSILRETAAVPAYELRDFKFIQQFSL